MGRTDGRTDGRTGRTGVTLNALSAILRIRGGIKMREAFAVQKLPTIFQQKILANFRYEHF